ncbi:MAG TPA: amidohydrolase family protein [Candidatus Methylomirabilis sp.]|nr:amidohydrolase family protein [Candidatus Methylomirabilis sp.]
MLDFQGCPVVDNHCHVLDPGKQSLEPIWLAREFFHGMADIPTPGVAKAKLWGATDDLRYHFPHMGVVLTTVCQLAKLFGCPAELEAVTAERNRRTAEGGLAGYAKMLYEDAGIVASVMDSDLPIDDPILDLTPGRKLRLLQMDPLVRKLVKSCASYSELLRSFQGSVERSVRQDGFVGIKSHLGELVGLGAAPVEADEAVRSFPAARAGEGDAFKKLYMAVWLATMLQCQELKIPLHIHTGFTGGLWNGPIANTDPFLLVPILRQPRFLQTQLVLLHAGHPWIQHAGAMAHAFPHVWVDIGWTTPWISQRIVECYRDLIGMAPLSKLMIGSGGHGSPEISWLAAKTAKIALGEVLSDSVRLGLMTGKDAERVGRMILYDNAARMYGMAC